MSRIFCCWWDTIIDLPKANITYITHDFTVLPGHWMSCGCILWLFSDTCDPRSWAWAGLIIFLPDGEVSRSISHYNSSMCVSLCIGFICYRNHSGKNFPTIISIPQEFDTAPKILNIIRVALMCLVLCQEHFFLKGILTRMRFCTKVINVQVMSDVLTTI